MPKKKTAQNGLTEESSPPLTGRGGINNFGNNMKELVKTDAQRAIAKKLLNETYEAYKQPKVKDDKELAERLDEYFAMCAQKGQVPCVEEMCLATGYAQSTIWDWENGRRKGFSSETAEIIKKAKDFMKTFDAKMVISGALSFLTYCFRAKNYYDMTDKKEFVVTPNNPLGDTVDPEELRRRIEDTVVVEDYDVEEG